MAEAKALKNVGVTKPVLQERSYIQHSRFSFTFTLRTMRSLQSNSVIATSPIFSTGDDMWCIEVSGNTVKHNLFLKLCNSHVPKIKAAFKFSISKLDDEKIFSKSSEISTFVPHTNEARHGFLDVVPDELLGIGLTILCEVDVESEPVCMPPIRFGLTSAIKSKRLGLDFFFGMPVFRRVAINIEGRTLSATKLILAVHSPVFLKMFEEMAKTTENQIFITDVDYETFEEMLRFISTGQVPNMDEMADKLLAAANKYEFLTLKAKCELAIKSKLTLENVAEMLILSDLHNADYLKSHVLTFITMNIPEVLETKGFRLLAKSYPQLMIDILRASA